VIFMEFWVIDHWAGGVALCQNEQGKTKKIPRESFPFWAKEGDWFYFMEDGGLFLSSKETKIRKNRAKIMRKRLLLR